MRFTRFIPTQSNPLRHEVIAARTAIGLIWIKEGLPAFTEDDQRVMSGGRLLRAALQFILDHSCPN
jgi:hypothetical protein